MRCVMLACKHVHGWTFDREMHEDEAKQSPNAFRCEAALIVKVRILRGMHEDEAKKGRMYVFSLQLERL